MASDAGEKLRTGIGVCKDLSCQKSTCGSGRGSTSARKMMLMVPGVTI